MSIVGFMGFLLLALFLIWFGTSILITFNQELFSGKEEVSFFLILAFLSLGPLLIGILIMIVFIRQIFYTKITDIVGLDKTSIKLRRKYRFISRLKGTIKIEKLKMIMAVTFGKYSALEFISNDTRVLFLENMSSKKINNIKDNLEKLLVRI